MAPEETRVHQLDVVVDDLGPRTLNVGPAAAGATLPTVLTRQPYGRLRLINQGASG